MRLIESLKRKKFVLLNIFFTLYIGINLIGGERGLISYFDKKRIYEELEIKNKVLTSELKELEHKISLVKNNDFDYFWILFIAQNRSSDRFNCVRIYNTSCNNCNNK